MDEARGLSTARERAGGGRARATVARVTQLLGLPYSPWSEKARWALDARRIPYADVTYAPLVGEPALRKKLGKWTGAVTVPVLTEDGGRVIADSAEIARWADGRGEGPAMYPRGREDDVARFVALSERGLAAGRALALRRMLDDDDALSEMVPKPLRRSLGKLATKVGAFGIRRTLRKYGAHGGSGDEWERELTGVLDELRAALASPSAAGDPKTLLGSFSFADVAMAQVLAFVEPPKTGLRIARASRRSFTDPVRRERYADLLQWRDALYAKYRSAASG